MALTRVANLSRSQRYDVYVGRAGKGEDGYFGNPYRVGYVCQRCAVLHETPASTLPCFDAYFRTRIANDAEFRTRVRALKGKILGCFCVPKPCHATLIADWLNRPEEQIDADTNVLIMLHTAEGRKYISRTLLKASRTHVEDRASRTLCERLLHDLLIVNGKDKCPTCGVTLISASPAWKASAR